MEDVEEYSTESLQRCSYRFLQQTAKTMGLPSNVKKVYLIQLIHTKKYCSPEQVDDLVEQVRLERKHVTLARKRKNRNRQIQQSTEISSTNSKSPPITSTPKRISHVMIRYSPEQYSPRKQPSRNINQTNNTFKCSDRVLRSFRSIRNPNYVLNNALYGVINSSSSEESVKSVGRKSVRTEDKYAQVNMMSVLKKNNVSWRNKEVVPVLRQRTVNISPKPIRQRRLSGIYPLIEDSKVPVVSIRRADGSVSKLNAFIGKSITLKTTERKDHGHISRNCEATERNVALSITSTANYIKAISNTTSQVASENAFSFSNTEDTLLNTSMFKENHGDYTVYYHKKIRGEQVRSLRTQEIEREDRLPKINDVFSRFNHVYPRDVTHPVYVQVDSQPEMVRNQSFVYPELNYQTTMLERLYNLKSDLIASQPLLQMKTTSATHCVYSTPIITTAKAQPSTNVNDFYNSAYMQDNLQYGMEDPRVYDLFENFRTGSGLTTASVRRSSSTESLQSQDLGANVTIPEMVEDALEIISQDGDYMERMGMDIRMQCILCEWAGPRIILEYHIRNEHKADLVPCSGGSCVTQYTLGALAARGGWLARVLEHERGLFILRARYKDPDRFAATLSCLTNEDDYPITGSITTHNKVTGEPFTWKGLIEQLPTTEACEEDPSGLSLELSRMNLLPNSANLELMNRELVKRSPNKVVVGQPELDNISISLTVKLND